MVEPISAVLGQLRGGEVRALAVTSRTRSALLPDVPTVAEALGQPDFDIETWYAIAAPAGTPPEILARIEEVTNGAVQTPEMRARLLELGLAPRPAASRAEVRAAVQAEIARWTRMVEVARIERQ